VNVLRPAILWKRGRSHGRNVSCCKDGAAEVQAITGNLVMPGFNLAPKLLWGEAARARYLLRKLSKVLLQKIICVFG